MEAKGLQQVEPEWTTLPLFSSGEDRVDPERRAEGAQDLVGRCTDEEAQSGIKGGEELCTTAELTRKAGSPQPRHIAAQPPAVQITPIHSKPDPPTAKVAPLLGPHSAVHRSHGASRDASSPSRSPSVSRKGHIGGNSSPTFDCRREKLHLLERDPYGSQNSPARRSADFSSGINPEKMRGLIQSLNDKNQVIERQKRTIEKLEGECAEKEHKLKLSSTIRALTETTSTAVEYKSSSLTDLASMLKPGELERLSKKLDAAYYDLDRANSKSLVLQDKLKSRDKFVTELQLKLEESNKQKTEQSQQLEKLQGYLGHMPTMEEHFGLQEQLEESNKQKAQLAEELKARDYEIDLLSQNMKEKDELLTATDAELADMAQRHSKLEQRTKSQDQMITELHSDNSKLRVELSDTQRELAEHDTHRIKELHAMRERHKQRFAEATAKLREQHKLLARRAKQLESQLTRNSEAMSALTNELQIRQGTIGELKASMEDLVTQNSVLLESNLSLKEANSEVAKSSLSDEQLKVVQQLALELSLCVDEFESLMSLAMSMMEGKDPNTSTLLGLKGGAMALPAEASYEQRLDQVRQFRGDIERLRTLMASHFANQVASDCAVQ